MLRGLPRKPLLIGVTVLTSMTDADLAELGYLDGAAARGATAGGPGGRLRAGWRGLLRPGGTGPAQGQGQGLSPGHPGIRLAGDEAGDQRRVVTLADAVANGAGITLSSAALSPLRQIPGRVAAGSHRTGAWLIKIKFGRVLAARPTLPDFSTVRMPARMQHVKWR